MPFGSHDRNATTHWQRLMARWDKAHQLYIAAVERLRDSTRHDQQTKLFEEEANARLEELTKIKAEIDETIRGAFKSRAPITDSLVVTTIETQSLTSSVADAPRQENGKIARGSKRGA